MFIFSQQFKIILLIPLGFHYTNGNGQFISILLKIVHVFSLPGWEGSLFLVWVTVTPSGESSSGSACFLQFW
jgi:hypothetical protein